MKRFTLPLLAATLLLSTSCKSKKASSTEMLTDVNELCKCYLAGKESSVKFMECSAQNEKMRDKYRSDNNALTQYDARLKKCMDGK
jgi:hypothetical protein